MAKKIVISKIGGPEVLKYIDYEVPKNIEENFIRIKQTAIGINYIDTYHRSGIYPLPSNLPICPGLEAAGEIIEIGTKVSNLIERYGYDVPFKESDETEMMDNTSDISKILSLGWNGPKVFIWK